MRRRAVLGIVLLGWVAVLPAQDVQRPGYDDTPLLPNSQWRVHDRARPYPSVVTPSPAVPSSAPPEDAIVLFDGSTLDAWQGGDGRPARWAVKDGYFEVNGRGDLRTKRAFGDCQLHIEWCAPAAAAKNSQGRGNSGLFLMDRYEIQILDSYRNPTYADGQAAALYGQYPPRVNACRPPGEWQSYDIVFEAPRFKDGRLLSPARVTVLHNGILVHHARAFMGPTRHRSLTRYEAHAAEAPLRLQDHGDPVRFRNIWVRPLTSRDR